MRGSQSKNKQQESDSNDLTAMFHNFQKDLSAIKLQLSDVTTMLSRLESLEKLLEARDNEILNLRAQVAEMEDKLDIQEQFVVRNEVEIIGVPEVPNENTYNIISLMACKIGVELKEDDVDAVFRSGPRRDPITLNSGKSLSRPIVIRLVRHKKRDEILKAAKVRKNLSTENVVSGPSTRLFINERLSRKNRLLFREARVRTQKHGFRFCWTKNGSIYVRKAEMEKAVRICSYADLDSKVGPTNI